MTTSLPQKRPYSPGIEFPANDPGDPAQVRVGDQDEAKVCRVGVICSGGTATPPSRSEASPTLEKVYARIYRSEDDANAVTDPPDPNEDSNARMIDKLESNSWEFDEIPNAQCENEGSNSDNWLKVWAVWSAGDPGSDIRHFYGHCDCKTDCE